MSVYCKLVSLPVILFLFLNLSAQIRVEVTNGAITEYNMAVSPISASSDSDAKLAGELTVAIEKVLDITGYFNILDKRSFLEKPDVPFENVNFKSWLNVGAKGLIKGTMKGKEKIELELAFFDISGGQKLLSKKYTAKPKSIKKAAYRFTSEVIALLTGQEMNFMFTQIAFIEKSDQQYSIVVTDFDGSNKRIIYSTKKILLLPEWSPDGKKIYFTSYEKNNPNLYSIDINTKQIKVVSAQEGLNSSATAHSDNKTITLCLSKDGNSEIYSLDTTTNELKRLTTSVAIDTAPSVNMAGTEIAFVSNRSGNPQIYKMSLSDPSKVERLTTQGKYNQDPEFSPDGKQIAFSGRDEFYRFDIFIFNIESRTIDRLTQNQGKNESPTFSPDGKLIAFSSNRNGKNELFLSNIKGDKQIKVYTGNGEVVTPSWSPEVTK